MTLYVYKRTADGIVRTPITNKADLAQLLKGLLYEGEMVALPGKKHRTYRAPVVLDNDNKPIKTPLTKIEGKKGA